MSTETLSMQTFGAFGGGELSPDASGLYSPQDCWNSSYLGIERSKLAADYMRFQRPSTTLSDSQPGFSTTTTGPSFNNNTAPATSSMFTAANAMAQNQTTQTISPLQTHFDSDHASSDSYSSSVTHMTPNSTETSTKHSPISKSRKDSHSPNAKLSGSGRRRKSEEAEIGSARQIYLEKNRKAASKCRNKQKRQQEDLVEEARDVERRNKLLKAEVDILRGGIRELMEHVAQHTDCPDSRLNLYVQREADRLATGDLRRMTYVQPTEISPQSHGIYPLKQESDFEIQ